MIYQKFGTVIKICFFLHKNSSSVNVSVDHTYLWIYLNLLLCLEIKVINLNDLSIGNFLGVHQEELLQYNFFSGFLKTSGSIIIFLDNNNITAIVHLYCLQSLFLPQCFLFQVQPLHTLRPGHLGFSQVVHLVHGHNVLPGQRQRGRRWSRGLERLLTKVANIDTIAHPREAVRDHLTEPAPAPTSLATVEVPVKLLPSWKGVVTDIAHVLESGGRQSLEVLLSLVTPQLGQSGTDNLTTLSLALKPALLVNPPHVGGEGGLGEPLLPPLVHPLAQLARKLALCVQKLVILESVLRISNHLSAGVTLEQVQPSQVNCQDMLLCGLMSALVLAHLALVLP